MIPALPERKDNMTAKGALMQQINMMSSGTIATFVNSDKYSVIDRASCKTLMYISTMMTEEECANIKTLSDIGHLFCIAQEVIR